MTILVRNKTVLAKEESVYGDDSTPTPADNAIEARTVKINYNSDLLERDYMRGNISAVSPVTGKRSVEVTFEMDLKGGGVAGTASKLGDMLEACGYAEVATAGSSVVYKPTSDSMKSATFYIYEHVSASSSKLHKVTGARGNFSIKLTAGQMAILSFTFKGEYNAPTDVAHPASPTYEATIPPVINSADFTLNSDDTLCVQELNLESGNELIEQECINSENGVSGFIISGRKPAGTMNPEAVSVADYDWYSDWIASTSRAMSVVVGSAAGNKITISAPAVTVDAIAEGDRNGILTTDIPFRMSQSAGNDELELKFE
jgi:hypothetical protein